MSGATANCTSCGAPIRIEVAGPFAGAAIAAAVCPACTDQQFLDAGGCVLVVRREIPGARFPLGKVTVTPGAVAALAESAEHAISFLSRHVCGDWGTFGSVDQIELTADELRRGWEATDDGAKINKSNLLNRRDRIMSAYTTARGTPLWVITSLENAGHTTVLLPEGY